MEWIIGRCQEQLNANETAIGLLPSRDDINTDQLDMDLNVLDELLTVEKAAWQDELDSVDAFLQGYGERVPAALFKQLRTISEQLK